MILGAHELNERVVDARAVRKPHARAGRELVEEEELLLLADPPVIPFSRELERGVVLLELLGLGEGDAVDALERVVVLVAEEVRGRVLEHVERLDSVRVGNVRPDAEIDHRPAAVDGRRGAVGHLGLDHVLLVLVVVEHLEQVGLGRDEPLERLLLVRRRFRQLLQRRVVALQHRLPVRHAHLVEEPVVRRRAEAEVAAVVPFRRLAEHVRRRVPEDLLACVVSHSVRR